MIPATIRRQLNRLRRRERLLSLAWISSRWLAVLAGVLAVACGVDWLIDLRRDTPLALRAGLLVGQSALWAVALFALLRVLARRISHAQAALWVEEKHPELGHCLISAVQLNQAGARTEGMSPELIAAVTRQAEEQAAHTSFTGVADPRRLRWSAGLLAPVLAVAALVAWLCPDTLRVLLARQLMADVPIPRSIAIAGAQPSLVWAAGEENALRFCVSGPVSAEHSGVVRIDWPDGRSEQHELRYEAADSSGAAWFVAHVPPGSDDFTCLAWLGDGRTHEATAVHYEPRPVVEEQMAWVRLPASCGLCGNGQPYEEAQKGGDVVFRVVGSEARISIRVQKPISRATVELLGPQHRLAVLAQASGANAETVRRRVHLEVAPDGQHAEGLFSFQSGPRAELLAALAAAPGAGCPTTLPWAALVLSQQDDLLPDETAYRVVVEDAYGLENRAPARRSIRRAPVPVPEVALLPETLWQDGDEGPPEDREIEGIPILLGQRVPLAYRCSSVYGISHARLRYRVVRRTSQQPEDSDTVRERDFLPLPLGAPTGSPQALSKKAQEELWTEPAEEPNQLSGTQGGGRYDFDSSGIPDSQGGRLRLQEGDRILFYVEVFSRADPGGAPGRSPLREKEVVGQKDFLAWLEKKEDQKERIRELEQRQRGQSETVAELPAPGEPPVDVPAPGSTPVAMEQPQPAEKLGFGRSWQLVGPFPSDNDGGHAHAFAPEQEPINLSREFDGIKGKVQWKLHESSDDRIDLQRFFRHGDAGVAYAVCWVQTPSRPAVLATGSDDGIKVWLDRKLIVDKATHREAVPRDDRTPVQLQGGWHEVLVKVDNRFGTWAFYLQLEDPSTGKPLPGLQVRTTPPTSEERRFVRNWQIIGPFANINGTGHDKVQPPETEPFNALHVFIGRHSRVSWSRHKSPQDRIDLLKLFYMTPDRADGVAYACCWVRSRRERQVILATGSDDGIKVWLNRHLVLNKSGQREAEPGQDRTPIMLRPDWNELLVKVDNRMGHWGFFFELRDPQTDAPADGLEIRPTPPTLDPSRFVRTWLLLGPFANADVQGHDRAYPPESDKIDLSKRYDSIRGKIGWQAYHSSEARIDLEQRFHHYNQSGVAYAACWVRCRGARKAILAVGQDDGIKVWINRRQVMDEGGVNQAVPGEHAQEVTFKEGWNEMLVKIDNQAGHWAFYLELRDARTGQPLRDVDFLTKPPGGRR